MHVKDLMSTNVISIAPEESAATAARLLRQYNIGALPVCSADGMVKGMITDRDIVLRCIAADQSPAQTHIRDIMSTRVISVSPEEDDTVAADMMGREQIRRIPVCKHGKLVGMLSLGDLVQQHMVEASNALSAICQNKHHL